MNIRRMSVLIVAGLASGAGLYVWAQDDRPKPDVVSDVLLILQNTTDVRRNPIEPPPTRTEPLTTMAPGTDTCLGMTWEPTIAVDPNDPNVVVAAQFLTMQISLDGGASFITPITATVPANWCAGGDPSLAFDSQGRLFITYLGSPPPFAGETCGNSTNPGRDVFISGYQRSGNTFIAIPGINWPVNVTAAAGFGAPNNADKEWLAADFSVASPFTDRLHMVWADLTPASWQIVYTFSTDNGATWQAGNVLTAADEGPRCWPPHIAVGPGGDVYVAYHSQPTFLEPSLRVPDGVSGQIVLHHSANGGVNFNPRSFPYPAGQADMTWNVQHLANGVIPGATFWLQGSSQPWILPDPIIAGRVYVVANDDPDNDVDVGDAADVFITRSNDFGATWNAPTRVDSGVAGSFQVMPTAAIDNITGAIAVTYYDNRAFADGDNDGNFDLDLFARYSFDGGITWQPEVDINDGRLDPQLSTSCRFCCCGPGDTCCGQAVTIRIGEYNGVAYGGCTAHFVWADNACSGGQLDTFYDRDAEAGGDLTPPDIDCPDHIQIGCNDPTDPSFTGAATATDNCDPNPDINFVDLEIPGDCPPGVVIGTIQRTWSATDAAGNINTCVQNISIVDADPPVITVPDPIVVECNSPGGVSINDPQIQAWLAAATAVDECSDATLVHNAPKLFPVGCNGGQVTVVIFTATDECGNSDFAVSSVTVVDTTPPAVTCSVQVTSLWAPNHAMVDVGWNAQVTDACDAKPQVVVTVTSDEDPMAASGAGGGIHCPDAIIGLDGTIRLRVERSGSGDGRVYRITITATDTCGNVGMCSADVMVPHHRNQTRIDSGQNYDATQCLP